MKTTQFLVKILGTYKAISRWTRKMPKPKNLSRLPGPPTDIYLTEELGYWDAFQRHLKLADFLRKNNFNEDAYRTLLFATECYLKDIFCTIRYEIFGKIDHKSPTHAWDKYPKILHEKFATALKSKKLFGHDLFVLLQFLTEAMPELDPNKDKDFSLFRITLPKNASWIEERYAQNTTISKAPFDSRYDQLLNALEGIQKNCLPRYK